MENTIEVVGNQNCRIRYDGVAYEFEEGKTTRIPEDMLKKLNDRWDCPVKTSVSKPESPKEKKPKKGDK